MDNQDDTKKERGQVLLSREQMLEQIVSKCVSLTDIMREFPCCDYEKLYNELHNDDELPIHPV